MTRKFFKHTLLLDEGFHIPSFFPRLRNYFNVKHITHDLKYIGLSDWKVYQLGVAQHRLIVTYNEKDFKALAAQSPDSGVLGVSPNLSVEQIDTKLTALLMRRSKNSLYGHFTSITGETTA